MEDINQETVHRHDAGCDGHGHHHHDGMHIHPVANNMKVALALNVSFTIIEFFGGLFTNSVAIISDAIHDLGDSLAIASALVLEKESERGRTATFTYGKRRFSTLAALITSLILFVGSVVITINAIPRFFHPEEVHVQGVLWLAILGLLFNGAAVLRLKKGNKSSLNQKAVMLHLMEDALGWIAVLIGGIVMYFTGWYWIDPLLSLGIAAFILFNAVKNISNGLSIFLQAKPHGIDEGKLLNELLAIPHVSDIHDLHIWTMDGEKHILTSHIVVPADSDITLMRRVREDVLQKLKNLNIQHPTIQIETSMETCRFTNC
ncbi:cation diffusion facilitator family transporter [Sphingobacterium athyrii]|uniref:Cation transporter n=1 Tax=Sphingobacterium athyrii TaxID=2152717 RepID=A0A363NTV0_9SPHI|nr:cation diffusion facilitator family transporter [Sphingobacterium athyrii]PUV24204.1 cation transporter [Sphingobacterium athyrii]